MDAHLLKRIRELNPEKDLSGFNILDFIYAEGSPFEALLYSRLFWPEFVEIDDMVFIKETFEDQDDRARLSRALETYGGNRQSTEKSFNFFDMSSLFGRRIGEATEEEDGWLLERLAQMWRFRLHQVFPSRSFLVEVLTAAQSGDEPGILFCQQAASTRTSPATA